MQVTRFSSNQAPADILVPAQTELCVVEEHFVEQSNVPRAASSTDIIVEEGASLLYSFNALSQGELKRTVTIHLKKNASVRFAGIVAAHKADALGLDLSIFHDEEHSTSRTSLRILATEQANIPVHGMIAIAENAHNSDANLESRALLLSDTARSEFIPSLEILCRDVKASHAAATGPIDADQLFYLQSRGLSPHEATLAVIDGFFSSLLLQLPQAADSAILKERWHDFVTTLV